MKKERIQISYSDLKLIYNQVIEFTNVNANWFVGLDQNTKLEEVLGFYGLDNGSFLTEFSEKFGVDFTKMAYEKILTPEYEVRNGKYPDICFLIMRVKLLMKMLQNQVKLNSLN